MTTLQTIRHIRFGVSFLLNALVLDRATEVDLSEFRVIDWAAVLGMTLIVRRATA